MFLFFSFINFHLAKRNKNIINTCWPVEFHFWDSILWSNSGFYSSRFFSVWEVWVRHLHHQSGAQGRCHAFMVVARANQPFWADIVGSDAQKLINCCCNPYLIVLPVFDRDAPKSFCIGMASQLTSYFVQLSWIRLLSPLIHPSPCPIVCTYISDHYWCGQLIHNIYVKTQSYP